MLLEHLKEESDIPTIPVYLADGGRSKAKVVGQKLDLPLVLFVPESHPAQQSWILESGPGSSEADEVVGEDVGALRQRACKTTSVTPPDR